MRNGTGECKVLIIDYDNVLSTSCTFLIDQLSANTIACGHIITLPSNKVYHGTFQELGHSIRKILLNSCAQYKSYKKYYCWDMHS